MIRPPGMIRPPELARPTEGVHRNTPSVKVRALPFPYRAAVTIASDIDGTRPDAFRAMHNLFTGDREGELGLEIGNSFWMYDIGRRDRAFAYFEGLGPNPSEHAPMIRDLARVGYLDVLHSYGNFLGVGEFRRPLAERAIDRLIADGIAIKVWVNHGGAPHHQKLLTRGGTLHHSIGRVFNGLGDWPGSVAYHADLLSQYGIRYSWDGLCWEIVGQERPASFFEAYLSPRGSVRPFSVTRRLAKGALALIRGTAHLRGPAGRFGSFHSYAGDNHLLMVKALLDGRQILEFKRYGAFSRDRTHHLPTILHPARLGLLCRVGGYMLIYNHLGKGSTAERPLPSEAIAALRRLAREQAEGRILVATVSRLLEFSRLTRYLDWVYRETPEGITIEISGLNDPISGPAEVRPEALSGLAFQVPRQVPARCVLMGEPLEVKREADPASPGNDALYWPWKPLGPARV